MSYRCESFVIEELVSPEVFKDRGQKAWELFDEKLLISIDAIKKRFPKGTMTINNWKWGGDRTQSGFREVGSKYYSKYSMHSFAKAIDAKFSAYDVNVVRRYIIDNPEEFPHVKGIENFKGMGWLHVDCRNRADAIVFGK